jgi:molybdopterin-guanine dinucleotide biosynthesis protein A
MKEENVLSEVFVIEKPELDSRGMIIVKSNFEAVNAALRDKLKPYTAMELTDDGLEKIKLVKKELRDLRLLTDKSAKEYLASTFNLPLNTIKAQTKDILSAIDEAESHIDSLLAAHDQKRIKALDAVYASYEKDALREYELVEGDVKFILGKSFYLKGAGSAQAQLKAEIFAQAKAVRDAQDKRAKDIKTVKAFCPVSVRPEPYIALLEHEDVSDVLEQIQKDSAPREEAPVKTVNTAVTQAEALTELSLRFTYPSSLRGTVEDAVRRLKSAGVSVKVIR